MAEHHYEERVERRRGNYDVIINVPSQSSGSGR
jgi:hypothetical protein